MAEPLLSDVHADLAARLKLDERLRAVEKEQASSTTSLRLLLQEHASDRLEQREAMQQMEQRLTAAIESAKPKLLQLAGILISGAGVLAAVFIAIVAGR